ncbi:MAG: sensor histidine kinase [Bacteroidota bacterium]
MFRIEKIYTSWTAERIARHVLYWMGWLFFYATLNSADPSHTMMDWIQVELFVMLIKLPFVYFVIYFLVPRFLFTKKYLVFIILLISVAAIGGFMLLYMYNDVIYPYVFGKGHSKGVKRVYYLLLDLIYIASLPTIYKLIQNQIQQERFTQKIVAQKLGAELKLLKNQLHPHFLFNTLNNLYGMVLSGHPQAADVVVRLSDLMSYMLYDCEGDRIGLEKEIGHLSNYIELEKIRYGERLELSFETSGAIQQQEIAPLLLIPFLENAFKHGVEKSEKNAWVRINLWVENDVLHFLIENSIPEGSDNELPDTQSGIGLQNVKQRLALLYPDRQELLVQKTDTFLVKLNLNLDDAVYNS